MLAKRLIHGLSLSMDSEEAMINKLKVKKQQISLAAVSNVNTRLLTYFFYFPSSNIRSKRAAMSSPANFTECTQTWAWALT